MSSPETQRLGEVLAIFEQEAASRQTRSTEGPTRRTKTRSDTQPGTGLPTLAAGATMALPANTLIGTEEPQQQARARRVLPR